MEAVLLTGFPCAGNLGSLLSPPQPARPTRLERPTRAATRQRRSRPLHQTSPLGTQRRENLPETSGPPRSNRDPNSPLHSPAHHIAPTEGLPKRCSTLLGDSSLLLAQVHEYWHARPLFQGGVEPQQIRHSRRARGLRYVGVGSALLAETLGVG